MKICDAVFVYHLAEHERVAWHGRYHAHGPNEYEAHFFLDGFGFFLSGKTRYAVRPEKFFMSPPGEFHSIIPDMTARPISYYAFLFSSGEDDRELQGLLKELFEKQAQELTASSAERLYCDDIIKLFRSNDWASTKAAEYALLSLLFRVCRQNGLCRAGEGEAGGADRSGKGLAPNCGHAYVTRALHLMQKNVRKNLGVDEIARLLALSTGHFIRIFRSEIKLTPYQYLLRLKIEGASGLLISTTKSIGEIAEWFGFENQFHFSRCFKKCTGVSPMEYRKTYLQTADFKV
ncbi:MAG: helix-turn-helix domain-containing protein [Treponema sp.]|jgi:AraC-like DNA-binding protein|nr:helix-turn-helix domain-containing protein [Treponema sp.]